MIGRLSNLSLVLAFALCHVYARSSVERHQAFLDLAHDEVLMNLSAHPDDEDGAALAYYRMRHGIRTYSVFFTRGEGGQNETGPELYEELGVLRSEETRAAGAILGTEVCFLNFVDFGYSRTGTETFHAWGGQTEVLRRLVYIIRRYKPDVIFTNHNTIDGHGQHQAVAIAAIAAFDAAADSTCFPEQLRPPGLHPWHPRKLFFRGWAGPGGRADVVNRVNEPDSLRGLTYVDLAMGALRMHRTQGLDRIGARGFTRREDRYNLVRSNSVYENDSSSFFGGINLWRDPGLTAAGALKTSLSAIRPPATRGSLLPTISRIQLQIDSLWARGPLSPTLERILGNWRSELETILRLSTGVNVSFTLDDSVLVPRQRVGCTLAVDAPAQSVDAVKCRFELPSGWRISEDEGNASDLEEHLVEKRYTLIVGDSVRYTLPKAKALYAPIGADQRLAAHVSVSLDEYPVGFTISPPHDVAPLLVHTVDPKVMWISRSQARAGGTFFCAVRNYLPHKTAGKIRCVAPPGWHAEEAAFIIDKEDSAVTARVFVAAPANVATGDYPLVFNSDYWSETVAVRVSEVLLSNSLRVGFVKGYDNTLESALQDLGAEFKEIDREGLSSGDLSRYATIVIDVRAFLVREDLRQFNRRLLDYVKHGGNLVVMYQRDREWKPEYAPFPFRIGNRRVSDEEAPVEVLYPEHPLFTQPNRISAEDWEGWKQERGVYFPTDVAPEYGQLVSTHDPDEPPLTTGYLVTRYGEGTYIYSSLVWYRQLREKHTGALRCFANMISYPTYRK